jgi:hypothetical protein
MRVNRKDNELNDYIEALDDKFLLARAQSKTDIEAIPRAWDMMDDDELEFVDRELERCISSRWYFMENYYVIRDEQGQLHTLHPFWDHQVLLQSVVEEEWQVNGCCRIIVLKPRQAGSTTWNAALIFHATLFVPNTYSMMMAQDTRVSGEIYQRVTDAKAQLPWWLQPEVLSKQQGLQLIFQRSDEHERLTDPGLGSALLISDSQKGSGVAIGRTIRNLLASEMSRWPDSTVWTTDIEPSLNAPDMLGVIESTAFGRSGTYYNMWEAEAEGESDWRAVFIPVYRVRKYFIPVTKAEKFVLTLEEKTVRSAVKAKEDFTIPFGFFKWRRRKIRASIAATGTEEAHKESYPLTPGEAFISSGFCAFPRKELDYQQVNHCRMPLYVGEIEYAGPEQPPILHLHKPTEDEIRKKPDRVNRLWIWETPKDGAEYQIGCDQGGSGEGNDFTASAVYSIGFDTGDRSSSIPDECVAEWHGHINASYMAKVLAALGYWYNTAEIAVEYMRDGITTGNDLQWVIDYPQIYRWRRMDKIGNTMSLHTHWMTTSITRDDAINRMCERLLDRQIKIHNVHTIEQMRNFGHEEDQIRNEAMSGHDDLVMAHLIAICSANQGNKRQLRAEAISMGAGQTSAAASSVMPKVPVKFAIYDHYGRQVQEVNSEAEGLKVIEACERQYNLQLKNVWKIVPIVVMKANSCFSPIFDGQGAERELYESGVSAKNITPDLVYLQREAMAHRRHANVLTGEDD